MVTPDDEPGREPVDPVYASLFRPEDPEAPELDAGLDVARAAEPAAAPPPIGAPASPVDTGRLFRSQGVTDNDVAVLALTSDHGGRLRTLAREQQEPSRAVTVNSAVAVTGAGAVVDDADVLDDAPVRERRGGRRRHRAPREIAHRSPGISAGAVYLVVLAATLIVGLVNAWLGGGELGWPTGLALLISTAYCAWRVRREDDVVAIIIPPIAFFLAAITAGQMFRGTTGGGLLTRVQLVFFTMAYNWYWVIGTTVVAVVLVLVRRRRG